MISLLSPSVLLITFPRSCLPKACHIIMKDMLFSRGHSSFFSITENGLEVSIVIESSNDIDLLRDACPEVEISTDVFRILQIDDDSGATSGQRISDISGPCARHSISIFFLSTYQTDFLLVKQRRIKYLIQILMDNNFEFDLDSIETELPGFLPTTPPSPSPILPVLPRQFNKCVLKNRLRCVGLNGEYSERWGLAILKVIFFPETVGVRSETELPLRFFSFTSYGNASSLIADEYLLSEFPDHTLHASEGGTRLRLIQVDLDGINLDRHGIICSISRPLVHCANINLLYLSTFRTANILVSQSDLEKAEEILAARTEQIGDKI